uniref:Uncharacterized protein n=1 Tax=Arundo donax TaxID=35708 RepID=A0A0A9B157_ARUDO
MLLTRSSSFNTAEFDQDDHWSGQVVRTPREVAQSSSVPIFFFARGRTSTAS